MDEKLYRQLIQRTMKPMSQEDKLAMLGLGIGGEAGEIVDLIKKVVYQGHEMDIRKLMSELGDLEWYITHLKEHYGITSDSVRQLNIEKLEERYPYGFSEENSINREL